MNLIERLRNYDYDQSDYDFLANEAADEIERLNAALRHTPVGYVTYEVVERLQRENEELREAATALVEDFKRRAVEVVNHWEVPVGNSAAGEMACEWTIQALCNVRDIIESLPLIEGEK